MRNKEYIKVTPPDDYPGKKQGGRYIYEHQLVWWQITGTLPPTGYVIHHIDENKKNNRFENLEIKERAQHSQEHGEEQKVPWVYLNCAYCEVLFLSRPKDYRLKSKKGRVKFYCSISCSTKDTFNVPKEGKKSICGESSGYSNGCRCKDCKEFQRVKQKEYRERKRDKKNALLA